MKIFKFKNLKRVSNLLFNSVFAKNLAQNRDFKPKHCKRFVDKFDAFTEKIDLIFILRGVFNSESLFFFFGT